MKLSHVLTALTLCAFSAACDTEMAAKAPAPVAHRHGALESGGGASTRSIGGAHGHYQCMERTDGLGGPECEYPQCVYEGGGYAPASRCAGQDVPECIINCRR